MVELVAAKCPQCGADLEFPDTIDVGHCMYCGGKVIVEKKIAETINIYNAQVDINKLLYIGYDHIVRNETQKASRYFEKANEADPLNAHVKKASKTGRSLIHHEKTIKLAKKILAGKSKHRRLLKSFNSELDNQNMELLGPLVFTILAFIAGLLLVSWDTCCGGLFFSCAIITGTWAYMVYQKVKKLQEKVRQGNDKLEEASNKMQESESRMKELLKKAHEERAYFASLIDKK